MLISDDPTDDSARVSDPVSEVYSRNSGYVGNVIRDSAHTGRHGDGKIFVSPITRVVSIRTGAEGESVL